MKEIAGSICHKTVLLPRLLLWDAILLFRNTILLFTRRKYNWRHRQRTVYSNSLCLRWRSLALSIHSCIYNRTPTELVVFFTFFFLYARVYYQRRVYTAVCVCRQTGPHPSFRLTFCHVILPLLQSGSTNTHVSFLLIYFDRVQGHNWLEVFFCKAISLCLFLLSRNLTFVNQTLFNRYSGIL